MAREPLNATEKPAAKRRPSRRIRQWLFLLTLVATLPFAILVFIQSATELRAMREAAEHSSYRRASNIALRLTGERTAARSLLEQLANRPEMRNPRAGENCGFGGFRESVPHYANIALYDLSGRPVCSAVPWPPGTTVAGQRWFLKITSTRKPLVSEPEQSPILHDWVVFHAQPVLDGNGALQAVLVATVRASAYREIMSTNASSPDVMALLIDGEGTIIARTRQHEQWVGKRALGAEAIRFTLATPATTFRGRGMEGVDRIYGLAALPDQGWHVLVGTPTAVVFAPMRRFLVVQSAILLVVLATFLALTTFVARRIERPIVALAQNTRQLMHSGAEGTLPEEGPAEIALLARSFNDMLNAHYRAEERVRESEARIQSIFSSAMDAIITTDEQQRIVLFNAAAESMFGISAAEARERPLSALMPERFRAQHAGHVQRFGDENHTQRGMGNLGAVYGLRAGGEEFPIEASISQVSLGGGKLYTVILRDITERLKAEQAIRESESRIAAALDASGSAAWDLDLRTGAFRHDDAFAAMLDLPRGVLVRTQEEVRSFFHPEDRSRVADEGARVIRGENDRLEIELRNVTRTGRLIWVVAAARVVERDGAGMATRMVGSTREITEKKHAQFRLERETEFNRTLVNSSPAFFVAVDPAGRIVVINDSILTALGYERHELLNRSFEIIMAARHVEQARDAFRMASESLEAITLEAITVEGILQTRDGREVVVDWRARPVLNESGKLEFVFAIGIDAGERRKQELARERYTELLAAVNETAITLLSHHDVEETLRMIATKAAALTGAAGSYVAIHDHERHNLRVVAATGISAPYIGREIEPGEDLAGRVHDTRQPAFVDDIQNCPGRAGATDIHAAAAIPILSGDEVLGALGIAETNPDKRISAEQMELLTRLAQLGSIAIDNARLVADAQREVADRSRAEEEVRRLNLGLENRVRERTAQLEDEIADRVSAQTALQERGNELAAANLELAAAAGMKDEFLANMSHELRTPLNAVLGMAEVLREGIHGPLNPKQESSLQIITDSGTHLLELINDILDLSKVEAGKVELDIQPSSVRSVADASLAMVREAAFRKQLTLELDIDPHVETVDADERRLKQILMNLLSNAVKFTPANGSVGLQITGDEEANEIRFTVWDTGIGIAGSEIPRLFTPFFQADSSFTRQYSGTGLGLTLVRRFAALHGGSVDLTSTLGEGSRFWVVLPWRHAGLIPRLTTAVLQEPAPKRRSSLQTHTRARPLILVAEDNETNIHLLESYLGALEMDIIVARDGAEAVAAARENRPDLILMDVQMPVVDGLEATRIIREAGADMNAIPIIAVTALAMAGDRERCLAAGADGYLTKPVSYETLEKAIGKLLASGR